MTPRHPPRALSSLTYIKAHAPSRLRDDATARVNPWPYLGDLEVPASSCSVVKERSASACQHFSPGAWCCRCPPTWSGYRLAALASPIRLAPAAEGVALSGLPSPARVPHPTAHAEPVEEGPRSAIDTKIGLMRQADCPLQASGGGLGGPRVSLRQFASNLVILAAPCPNRKPIVNFGLWNLDSRF